MGEVLPNAIPLMAKAAQDAGISVDGTVKSMMELQQKGALISSEVLPHFAKRLSDAAQANGGLNSALNSNRVAMNRMITSFQMAADTFFKSNFSEGLTDTFNSIADMIKKAAPLWRGIGNIIGSVLKGISIVIDEVLTPILSALGVVVDTVAKFFGDFAGIIAAVVFAVTPMGRLFGTLFKTISGGQGVFAGLAKAAGLIVAPLMIALGVLEEIAEFFNPTAGKKTLIGVNINDIMPDINAMNKTIKDNLDISTDDKKLQAKVQQKMYAPRQGGSFSQATYGQAFAPKEIRVPLFLNGTQIAEAVADETAIKDSMQREIETHTGSNYN